MTSIDQPIIDLQAALRPFASQPAFGIGDRVTVDRDNLPPADGVVIAAKRRLREWPDADDDSRRFACTPWQYTVAAVALDHWSVTEFGTGKVVELADVGEHRIRLLSRAVAA